jgi:hypothetical protein
MTDFRALCQELIDEIDAKAYGIKSLPSSVAIDRARAALEAQPEPKTSRLRYCDVHGQQPENAWGCPECVREMRHQLAQPEPQGPSDQELLRIYRVATPCYQVEEYRRELDFARAVLARWGRPAIQPEPQGPSDEKLLRCYGLAKRDHCYEGPIDDWPKRAERAATVHGLRAVLARWGRPAIEPVPVSERLPGPADCDAEGKCWFGTPSSYVMVANWVYEKAEHCRSWNTHWAPHWALPVLGVEGE